MHMRIDINILSNVIVFCMFFSNISVDNISILLNWQLNISRRVRLDSKAILESLPLSRSLSVHAQATRCARRFYAPQSKQATLTLVSQPISVICYVLPIQ